MPLRSTRRNLSAGRRHAAGSSGRVAEVAKFLAHHTDLKSAEGRRYMVRRDGLPERQVVTYGAHLCVARLYLSPHAPRQLHRFDAAGIVAADCFVSLLRMLFGLRGAPFPLVSCRGT
jgi:hypothetical protein